MATRVITGTDELKSLVGEHLGYSDYMEITQDRVNKFADATGDHQWIHVDVERAKAGPFGGPIAHGYLTLSLGPVLYPTIVRIEGFSMGVNYGANKVRFPAPVPVGAQPAARRQAARRSRTSPVACRRRWSSPSSVRAPASRPASPRSSSAATSSPPPAAPPPTARHHGPPPRPAPHRRTTSVCAPGCAMRNPARKHPSPPPRTPSVCAPGCAMRNPARKHLAHRPEPRTVEQGPGGQRNSGITCVATSSRVCVSG